MVTDPDANCLLIRATFEPLTGGREDYRLYVLLAPRPKNRGTGNLGRVRNVGGKTVLTAWREDVALALAASVPVRRASCGFVGFSGGWTDLHQDLRLDWKFASATDGHIALTAELDLGCGPEFTLALGFGLDPEEATRTALSSLARPFARVERKYIREWKRWSTGLTDLGKHSGDGGVLQRISRVVLKAHEDKTYPGAFIASLSVPWGKVAKDANTGGYHLCWPRDLVHIATGLLAVGDTGAARRALRYLGQIQNPADGSWPQNCWVKGRPYWTGLQLDGVALPILLAWRLYRAGLLRGGELKHRYRMVRAAALCLARCGPVTPQERWEENGGYSPGTLAAAIVGLVCAAGFADLVEEQQRSPTSGRPGSKTGPSPAAGNCCRATGNTTNGLRWCRRQKPSRRAWSVGCCWPLPTGLAT